MVIVDETTIGDLFGFDDHDFSLFGINCHIHPEAIIMEGLKLLIEIIMASTRRTISSTYRRRVMTIPASSGPLHPVVSKHSSSLSM